MQHICEPVHLNIAQDFKKAFDKVALSAWAWIKLSGVFRAACFFVYWKFMYL